jgi:hypothetical protein
MLAQASIQGRNTGAPALDAGLRWHNKEYAIAPSG